MKIPWLPENELIFPPLEWAGPDGLLAAGGDLSPERILTAYSLGIFPWYNEYNPILWWSPDPRFVLFPEELKVSKSMRPYFNQKKFTVTYDQQFETVMRHCKHQLRKGQQGTWITEEMVDGYVKVHEMGYAHSVEVWQGEQLAGGLYGIALGKCFFGESMFANVSNASKFGFISLVRKLREQGFELIDCQQETGHLGSLGAKLISRSEFVAFLKKNEQEPTLIGNWQEILNKE